MSQKLIAVLGADDPEMVEMTSLLQSSGVPFVYATAEGKRVHPGNAYQADPVEGYGGASVVLIECEPKNFRKGDSGGDKMATIIDHHRPGDPGFGLPPEQYWEASSIGQLYKVLDLREPPQGHRVLAAMDHCPAAARQGKCPGVTAGEVRDLKRSHIARGCGTDEFHVEEAVAKAGEVFRGSPKVHFGTDFPVTDASAHSFGVGYSLEYLAAQEWLLEHNQSAILQTRDTVSGPEKFVICGAASPEMIEYFMKVWAPAHGLVKIYGVPVRGYAGGYKGS